MTALVLRPYQEALSGAIDQAFAQGAGGVCAVLPTGGGKTAVLARRIQTSGQRVAVVAHRTELIEQTIATLRRAGVGSIGAIAAKLPHLRAEHAQVQVCSLQTLLARGTTLALDRIILDEAHHYADDSHWGGFVETYGTVPREGYTATPQRGDGKGLRGAFDALAVGPSVAELTDLGHLVPFRIFAPPIHLGGRLAQDPIAYWLEKGCAGKRTLVFAKSKAHGAELEQGYAAAGYPALLIHEGTPRSQGLRAFAQYLASPTQLPVLTNVFRLTEGTDLPATEVVQLCRSCDEDITYMQAVGRGSRPSPATGKLSCTVLDMCGATRKHGHPRVPRVYSLDGKGMQSTGEGDVWQCASCGGIPDTHERGEPCPFCGALPAVEARDRKAVPTVTGDAMHEVHPEGKDGPAWAMSDEQWAAAEAARDAANSPERIARVIADREDAKRARANRAKHGPVDPAAFGASLQNRFALWHAQGERKTQRP